MHLSSHSPSETQGRTCWFAPQHQPVGLELGSVLALRVLEAKGNCWWMDGTSMGSSEHWNSALPTPTPCRDRQQDIITGSQIPAIPLNPATSTDSPSTTQEWDKQGTPGGATSDNPNITWMPWVIKLIPKLAFEPCTDNEHRESWKTGSLWSGRNVHRGEKEEFRQTLSISTVIQKLCPSWTDTIMHTKSNSI